MRRRIHKKKKRVEKYYALGGESWRREDRREKIEKSNR